MSRDSFENFIEAFRELGGGCRRTCACGREFYNPDGGWTWEEGELDGLEGDQNATALEYTVQTIAFGTNVYAVDCDCWKNEAEKTMKLLHRYGYAIADFFRREKERRHCEADLSPVIDEGPMKETSDA